jgi:hypothetical protein
MEKMTDREAYPAAWVTLAMLLGIFLSWRYVLGAPAISGCWIWEHLHVYCPGCGGTRALIALAHGQLPLAFYYHPAVPVTVALAAVYLMSQTVWRLRGQRGWVLHYSPKWPIMLVGLFLMNCAIRNVLWLGFAMPIS